MITVAAILLFVAVVALGYALAVSMNIREEQKETLGRRLSAMVGVSPGGPRGSALRDQRLSAITALDAFLQRQSFTERMVRMIQQAGIRRRVGEVLLYVPLLAGIGFCGVLLAGGTQALAIFAAFVGGALPLVMVNAKRRKRGRLFAEQLPDALDLVRAALQAGHGLSAALAVVAAEFPNPIAEELHEVAEEMRLGLPLRDALYHLGERVNDPNLPILIVGVLVAQESGGNLAEVMDNISHTIRERFKLLRQTRVLTAQGRLSAGILCVMPVVWLLGMYFLNREYLMALNSPLGRWVVTYATVSIVMGWLVVQKLVRIKV